MRISRSNAAEGQGFVVAASEFGSAFLLERWNEYAVTRGLGFYPVLLQNLVGYAGPLVNPWRVAFKRYLAPLALAPDEQACLAQLARPRSLAELASALGCDHDACRGLLEQMGRRRLVTVT